MLLVFALKIEKVINYEIDLLRVFLFINLIFNL